MIFFRRGNEPTDKDEPWTEETYRSGLRDGELIDTDMWSSKPAWCQPWTILTTGSAVIGGVWGISSNIWATGLVAVPVFLWWYLFLIVVPDSYRLQAQEQNNRR